MVYELINPSDSYTLEADTAAVAMAVVLVLGGGSYGIKAEGVKHFYPPFPGTDLLGLFREDFGVSVEETLKRAAECAAVCESFLCGPPHLRAIYLEGLGGCEDEQARTKWRNEWHDANRSSLSDIGRSAWELGAKFRALAQAEEVA